MSKPYSDPREQDVVEHAREAAIKRIHETELNRLDAILVGYEIERANAKHAVRNACDRFGSNHVAEWVLDNARALGHKL